MVYPLEVIVGLAGELSLLARSFEIDIRMLRLEQLLDAGRCVLGNLRGGLDRLDDGYPLPRPPTVGFAVADSHPGLRIEGRAYVVTLESAFDVLGELAQRDRLTRLAAVVAGQGPPLHSDRGAKEGLVHALAADPIGCKAIVIIDIHLAILARLSPSDQPDERPAWPHGPAVWRARRVHAKAHLGRGRAGSTV